ncbi:uncharacterized protein LOC113202673 [Frankliniella occidentalis]|uniref:Uncharacterized protein LOC113202673 n=1 Tax=Frankliniella occidentalis TaxID=133901 RepID=A0A6J1S0S4_FRAOC|nr:uncharacterized protein LOC113202673 [Frankliniella occidentalis]
MEVSNIHVLQPSVPRDQVAVQPAAKPRDPAAATAAIAQPVPSGPKADAGAKRSMQEPPAKAPKRRRKQSKPPAAPQGKPPASAAPKGKRPQQKQGHPQPPQRKAPQGKPPLQVRGKHIKQPPTYDQLKVQLDSALASARHSSERLRVSRSRTLQYDAGATSQAGNTPSKSGKSDSDAESTQDTADVEEKSSNGRGISLTPANSANMSGLASWTST